MFKSEKSMKIVAGVLAASVMCGALVYYNVIDKATVSGAKEGNKCPDFTAQLYEVKDDVFSLSEETFTLSQKIGTVCVINFWATWCVPCIQELPEFDRLQVEYGDKVEMIAVVVANPPEEGNDPIADWLTNKEWEEYDSNHDWADFSLKIAYLPPEKHTALGASGAPLPRTIIVDKSGIIGYEKNMKMSYELLKAEIDELL